MPNQPKFECDLWRGRFSAHGLSAIIAVVVVIGMLLFFILIRWGILR